MGIEEAEERSLEEEEQPRIIKNIDMKRDDRRAWHLFLWLRGHTREEIGEITGWSRTTIYWDLTNVREERNANPKSMAQIRDEALISLRMMQHEILRTIKEAKQDGAPYNHIKGLYAEATSIDKTILQRYTQTAATPEIEAQIVAEADEQLRAMLDYLVEKMGPEAVAGFQDWWGDRMALLKRRKVKSFQTS